MTSWIRRLEVAFLLLVLAFTTASCGVSATSGGLVKQAAEAAEASPTETSTATPLPTAMPTSTPLPPPTATPTPPPTSTFTPVPSPLDTPTPPPPPTATYPPPPEEVRVPILMYHYVSELPPDADTYRRDLTVSPATFEAHLRYLQAQGYQSVSLADVYATLSTGKPLPERPIVLTFDDGYKDAYTHALPLLTQYGFQGEFFVLATPAHYEAAQYLTWDEMRAMAEAGMSMQAHGRDHFDLTGRDYEFLVYQILGAKEAVEAHTGQSVRFFCYPSGRYDEDAMAVVEAAGYWGAVTTEWGAALRLDNRFAWPRIRVRGNWSADALAGVLESVH